MNAVSWAQNGELLLTGGDDTTVRMWRADPDQAEHEHPLVCTAVVETGHQSNIFGVQMLPYSTRAYVVLSLRKPPNSITIYIMRSV